MRVFGVILSAGMVIGACTPQVPDSAAGVGFEDYSGYQAQRQAELSGRPAPVPSGPVIATETVGTASVPVIASEDPGAPPINLNNPGISDEQSFEAVSARESIQSDAARLAANREAYVVVQPTALPTRPADGRPNIVAFALATNNPPGVQLYDRSGASVNRFNRACGGYTSSDLAQEDFLAKGGPERDRMGVDPDGDGYACYWDPTPFRAARGG